MKVLVIEEDDTLAGSLRALLENWGHDTQLCTTGKDAVRKFATGGYDVVLTEVLLPDMSGIDLISRLKEFSPDAWVVAMTGRNSRELEARIRELGILYYMVKPLETENLKSLLEHLSKKSRELKYWSARK
jgi:DNA-binding response OmpR family regulator